MNFQSCRNTSDAIPLYLPQQLYLKPIARMHITVQLPTNIKADNTVSNWEIMEKLRNMIKPDEFCILKVATSSIEFIRFEAEIEDRAKLKRVIEHLSESTIKLKGYSENLKVRAVETKLDFPSRHSWDSYFRDATNMDEMKPGERPDTVHISNLPIKWFLSKHATKRLDDESSKPSENLLHRIFSKFGDIRFVDIPICDPYRSKMKAHMSGMQTFSFDQELFFEGYVQYRDYISFVRAMDAFHNMKLLRKEGDKAYAVNIKVDFDKTKHLSDASIRRRQIVRDRLVAREKEREEKEKKAMETEEKHKEVERQRELNAQQQKQQRQQEREERRKTQQLSRLKATESEEINKKIAIEEKKLLKAQRKLQAIRLTEELLRRIRVKKENELLKSKMNSEKSKDKKSVDELEEKRLKLQKTVAERETIKKLLGLTIKSKNDSASSDDGDKKKKKLKKKKKKDAKSEDEKDKSKLSSDVVPPPMDAPFLPMNSNWYGYTPMYPTAGPVFGIPLQGPSTHPFPPRGRGFYPRRRGSFNPDYKHGWRGRGHHMNLNIPTPDDEYYRYFKKLSGYTNEHDDREDSRSRSHSRSRSRSRSRKRSRTRSEDELSESYPTSAGVHGEQNYKNYRGRGMRGFFPRRRGGFNPRFRGRGGFNPLSLVDVDPNYLEYLQKMAGYAEKSARSKSYSRSRSRSHRRRSYSRSRSRSKRRSRRSRSSSGSSRHHSRRSYHSRSRSRSRKRSRSRDSSRSRSKSRNHSKSKRSRSRSRSKSKNHTKSKRSRSRSSSYKSIDSSKFISPSRLRIQKSRSKSWSLPPRRSKDKNEKRDRSWSKSGEEDVDKE
ncbi:A-kinase anchor protein 17A [Chrysoperla carnea]|uniref:A-kinase anchor protein 17A n=1 Tax=Chrysoperla carnea TaxID=189513 RepID=UPI001D077136|nr:A-kinase anchor protein 17A [Chrysoperla carnea]